ncbi:hypothetical protein CLOHIR_01354 [Peptacetobacter hiranonis DSM 13275]|uniref:Uncharacterized protein n=1 Tax=Peptacetobacter hiranonis (strain DSM 13275 / JCM 10541 / KCTC 15199 / TO-931) TaxID=500633 RepID=B6FZQ1_PEPHT|nr:hypothetical protein CLOHIR_01354 [Peptacetobacter hiranonis DSM 13275]
MLPYGSGIMKRIIPNSDGIKNLKNPAAVMDFSFVLLLKIIPPKNLDFKYFYEI